MSSSPTKRMHAAIAIDEEHDTTSTKSARTCNDELRVISSDDCRESTAQLLAHVLRLTDLFAYLSIRDTARLLYCCKAIYMDTELAALALQASPLHEIAQHFSTKCDLDWFRLDPRRCPTGYEDDASDCDHTTPSEEDDSDEESDDDADNTNGTDDTSDREDDDTPVKTPALLTIDARFVAVVAAVEGFVLPANPGYDAGVGNGDNVYATPVVIPLRSYHPDGANLPVFHDWSREDVRVSLNALRASFGDRFVDDDPEHAYKTEFGLHWDNTTLSPESGEAECAFCGVTDYIRARCDAKEADGDNGNVNATRALHASSLGVKYAHYEPALQTMHSDNDDKDAFWDDRVKFYDALRPVGLVVFPIDESDRLLDDNGDRIKDHYGDSLPYLKYYDYSIESAGDDDYRDVCTEVVLPLKKFLLQNCRFTRRMRYVWYIDECDGEYNMISDIAVELLAGVTPSGYLCGAYFIRNIL